MKDGSNAVSASSVVFSAIVSAESILSIGAALDDSDDRLDDYANDLVTSVLTDHRAHERDPQTSIQMALIGRFYERVGDHAVNIGEWVRFIVEGWRPEDVGAARATANTEDE